MPRTTKSAAPAETAAHSETAEHHFEGDYRPTGEGTELPNATAVGAATPNIRLEPLQLDFLMRLADALQVQERNAGEKAGR